MMILIILDRKIIKIVTMGWPIPPGKIRTTLKIHNTPLDLLIREIPLPHPPPPRSFHIIPHQSHLRDPVGGIPAATDQCIISPIPQNVNFAFVGVGQHLADSQSIFSLGFAASSNIVFMEQIVPDVLLCLKTMYNSIQIVMSKF